MVAAVARGASLQVDHAPFDLLHAQRVDITDRFEIVRLELSPSAIEGRGSAPVEINEALPPARAASVSGGWAYTVVMRERAADEVSEGVFDVTLELAGETVGIVRLLQDVQNPLAQEGATVIFSLGATLPDAPLLVVSVREIPQGRVIHLASAVNAALEYVWQDEAGVENPTFALSTGEATLFVITNGDGTSPHNFRIQDGTDPPPTTPDIVDVGDEESVAWTPPRAGSYSYLCQYHPTMKGNIEVTE